MGPRRISRLSFQLFLIDLLIILIGLAITSWLRWVFPFGQDLPGSAVNLPFPVYLTITLCWSISLVLIRAYDHQQVLRWYNEVSRVVTAGLLATVITVVVLYSLSPRLRWWAS